MTLHRFAPGPGLFGAGGVPHAGDLCRVLGSAFQDEPAMPRVRVRWLSGASRGREDIVYRADLEPVPEAPSLFDSSPLGATIP